MQCNQSKHLLWFERNQDGSSRAFESRFNEEKILTERIINLDPSISQ